MIHVRQKFKHCFVACVVSSLEDKRLRDTQTAIVSQFPTELQKTLPDEGVPKTKQDFDAVVIGLGLAAHVHWIDDTSQIQPFLTENGNVPNDMFLMTRDSPVSTNHCVRIKKILGHGVEVMNPEADFEIWDWKKITDSLARLAVFLSAEDVSRLSHPKPNDTPKEG
jgi:hypothetical protein